jgi:hypothetical protein
MICVTIEKSKLIRSKIITLLLLRQNVEANPAPNKKNIKPNLNLIIYGCNGLGDLNKFRMLLIQLRKKVQKGGIITDCRKHILLKKNC